MLAALQNRIAAVVALLQAGDMVGGAQCFVETVAFGPGAWSQLPQATQETFIFNAPTWLDEIREPGSTTISIVLAYEPPRGIRTRGGRLHPWYCNSASGQRGLTSKA